jgi:hypothetical protein
MPDVRLLLLFTDKFQLPVIILGGRRFVGKTFVLSLTLKALANFSPGLRSGNPGVNGTFILAQP